MQSGNAGVVILAGAASLAGTMVFAVRNYNVYLAAGGRTNTRHEGAPQAGENALLVDPKEV